jgi:hypothetical protein
MSAAAADEHAQRREAVERVLCGEELRRVADVDTAGCAVVSAAVVRGLLWHEDKTLFSGHQLQRCLDASPALTLRNDMGKKKCRLWWTLNGARTPRALVQQRRGCHAATLLLHQRLRRPPRLLPGAA